MDNGEQLFLNYPHKSFIKNKYINNNDFNSNINNNTIAILNSKNKCLNATVNKFDNNNNQKLFHQLDIAEVNISNNNISIYDWFDFSNQALLNSHIKIKFDEIKSQYLTPNIITPEGNIEQNDKNMSQLVKQLQLKHPHHIHNDFIKKIPLCVNTGSILFLGE